MNDETDDFRRQELAEMMQLEYRESRIPALDALEVFVPNGGERDAVIDELMGRTGFSRWKPVEGGHQVLILYEGGGFDPTRFTLRTGAWDHEHCKRCVNRIAVMELCWVSTKGYTVLCESCYRFVVAAIVDATTFVLDIGETQTRYVGEDALLASLAEVEREAQGCVSVVIDRGETRGWRRFLGGVKRDVTLCFAIEWVDDYASLIFHDDACSEYRAVDRERPVRPAEALRLQIAHGESAPHPIDECMEKRRAFEAVREFIPTRSRPEWLTYKYVP